VIRTANLIVEVFIDVEDDGAAHAEALLLHNADKRLLARGYAYLGSHDPATGPVGDCRVTARALVDLAGILLGCTGDAR
jgi:hypothetical protein